MRRALLVLFAATLLLLAMGLATVALVLGLHEVMPLWAAFALGSLLFVLLAGVLFLAATRQAAATESPTAPATDALAIGETVGRAVRQRPKTAMAAAFAVGIALGANPGLRRDLVTLLGKAARGND